MEPASSLKSQQCITLALINLHSASPEREFRRKIAFCQGSKFGGVERAVDTVKLTNEI